MTSIMESIDVMGANRLIFKLSVMVILVMVVMVSISVKHFLFSLVLLMLIWFGELIWLKFSSLI